MEQPFKIKTLKERYTELIINKLSISYDDLTNTEKDIINLTYELFEEKLDDIKILNDEIKRISLELANLKSYQDDSDYGYDEES
jgi:DNA mismatch repair ATPase MutS